jgi:serine phosphatase RsbU (regulator of sigma subunit)
LRAVFDSLWKPVDRVAEISDAVASGQYAFDVDYPFRDEMAVIFERLARMARLLASREAGLRRMTHVLEGSLETTRAMTLALDPFSAVAQVQAQVALRLRFSGPPEGWLAVRSTSGGVSLLPVSDSGSAEATAISLWNGYAEGFRKELLLRATRVISDIDASGAPGLESDVDVTLVSFALDKPYIRLAVRREGKVLAHMVGPLLSRQVSAEDIALCRSLCASLRVVLENIDLRLDATAKARLESELETAEAMQQNMIRVECDDPRLDVSARCAPAARVGGDWCGVHEARSQGCVYIFVADVTGHGIDSSLVSAAACGVMNALCSLADSGCAPELAAPPSERLPAMTRILNQSLLRTGRGRYAMTLALACVEPSSRRVTWLSCGHTPGWRFGGQKGAASMPSRGSLLGLTEDVTFEVKERTFEEGEALFLYTDGLLENEGPQGERVSTRTLKNLLASLEVKDARATLDAIMAHYSGVVGHADAADDTTCLVLRFRSSEEISGKQHSLDAA